jgi:hypothetical protein
MVTGFVSEAANLSSSPVLMTTPYFPTPSVSIKL